MGMIVYDAEAVFGPASRHILEVTVVTAEEDLVSSDAIVHVVIFLFCQAASLGLMARSSEADLQH